MKKLSRSVVMAALLLTATVFAKAANPIFHMDDPGTGLPITDLSFGFSSNGAGGGFFEFMNETSFDWFGLNVQVVQPTGTSIDCTGGPFFSTCLVSPGVSTTPLPPGFTLYNLSLSSVLKGNGIANGEYFTINLNNRLEGLQPLDPAGLGDWGPNVPFSAQVTTYLPSASTPEPQTWGLLLAGVLVIGSASYIRKQRVN